MLKKILLITICFISVNLIAQLQPPFDQVKLLPLDMHGWFTPANQLKLKEFVEKLQPKIAVEIGTWLGVSAIYTAKLLPKNSKLYCIDPWEPYVEMAGVKECEIRFNTAYEQFLSNCIHNNVADKIIPLKMRSQEAVKLLATVNNIDLIYVDGSHQEDDVYNDILAWYPKLSKIGIICGDDVFIEGVRKGYTKAASKLNLKVQVYGNFWWLER